jgi:hypothetical protein
VAATLKVSVAVPLDEAVAVPTVLDELTVLNHLNVTVSPDTNPVPVAVTLEPTVPAVAFRFIVGVTVKFDETFTPLVELTPFTLWTPPTPAGAAKVTDPEPIADTVVEPTATEVDDVVNQLTVTAWLAP